MKSFASALTLALASASSFPITLAYAASSEWHHVQGGAVRLVTTGAPAADGMLKAVLEIALNPGWKTYWVDPGASGVPPTLDISADGQKIATVMHFPAPDRFDDGYTHWAGYPGSVTLPVEIDLSAHAQGLPRIEANAFLGICETICIPVQAALSLELGEADHPADAALVRSAFAALPPAAHDGFGVDSVTIEATGLALAVSAPAGAHLEDLYLAGTDTLMFDTPVKDASGTKFLVPYVGRGKPKGGEKLLYTLRTSAGDVTGHITLP
jgi:DsbC/DsbD-like thiol-disulfide interchange protein